MTEEGLLDGLAEAVRTRMRELRLAPKDLEPRSGLTAQQWQHVRTGRRRNYQSRTIFGVAKALEWEPDWYDRILRGEAPVPRSTRSSAHVHGEVPEELPDRLGALEERMATMTTNYDELLNRVLGIQRSVDRIRDALALPDPEGPEEAAPPA